MIGCVLSLGRTRAARGLRRNRVAEVDGHCARVERFGQPGDGREALVGGRRWRSEQRRGRPGVGKAVEWALRLDGWMAAAHARQSVR
eukprot:scaffold119710_cov63-Phaeocystis_antarctica.AAC.5